MLKERSYPAFEPGPDNGPWRDITLYAITGWYFQTLLDGRGGAFAFGGFIKVAENGSFVGMLVDSFGASAICGTKTAEALTFDKHYFVPGQNRVPITYAFHKEGDEWKGEYRVPGCTVEDGRAACKVFSAIEDAFGVAHGRPRYQIDDDG